MTPPHDPGWDRHPGVRTGHRLTLGERATDLVFRGTASWTWLALLATTTTVAVVLAVQHDGGAGAVAQLSLVLSGLALLEVSVVLMAERRRERNTIEAALYDLDQSRRATAVAEDLRDEVERLHRDVARIAAQTARPTRRDG
jgi:uncharacterized membrane protein